MVGYSISVAMVGLKRAATAAARLCSNKVEQLVSFLPRLPCRLLKKACLSWSPLFSTAMSALNARNANWRRFTLKRLPNTASSMAYYFYFLGICQGHAAVCRQMSGEAGLKPRSQFRRRRGGVQVNVGSSRAPI